MLRQALKLTVKVLHTVHRAKKVEGLVVAIATTCAVSGLDHVDVPFIPLDKLGAWADVIAGAFAACALLLTWLEKKYGHGEAHEH